ncbi:hypothetical protein ABTX80_36385 [Streptomyces erythrochromogenes]|uniref:hypothetical protein n=1 Tax=Streptomyces erythrochromogenes TaxID=285574 RepID=UPI003330CFC6
MQMALIGLLLLVSAAAVPACALVLFLMLRNPPRPPSRIAALLAVISASAAAAVYCYGWFSVTLGGPFPALCEDTGASGARLASLDQDYWPLRNACIYSDGSTVEHVSASINVSVHVLAGLAVVLTCASVFTYRRARHLPEGTS